MPNLEIGKPITIELKVKPSLTKKVFEIVSKNVLPDELYYSSEFEWVKGNVAGTAHLTLAYGLTLSDGQEVKIEEFQDCLSMVVRIDTIGFFVVHDNKYLVVYAGLLVPKSLEEKVFTLSTKGAFTDIAKPFHPHITLCYVKKESNLEKILDILKELIGMNISFSSVNIENT